MTLVEEKIADGNVLRWLKAFLVQPIEDQGKREIPVKGSPQGGVISPILANIYLHPLDQLLDGQNIPFARYADDIVILAKTSEEAHQILEKVGQWMAQAQLELHPEKTRIVDMTQSSHHFDFLGYRFYKSKKGKLLRLIRPKSEKKLRDSIRPLTKRTSGQSLERIIQTLNPRLSGWYAYFKQAQISSLGEMDGWVRMRLRSILRKREGKEGKGRGKDHQKWKNCYFAALGLYSLEAAKVAEPSLRCKGAKC